MVSYFLSYEGEAKNSDGFVGYYCSRHIELLKRFPGVCQIILHVPMEWDDPVPVKRGGIAMIAQLVFESAEALNAALTSQERLDARTAFTNYPAFEGRTVHQAMASEVMYVKP
jgi:hypothetical protein